MGNHKGVNSQTLPALGWIKVQGKWPTLQVGKSKLPTDRRPAQVTQGAAGFNEGCAELYKTFSKPTFRLRLKVGPKTTETPH